MRNIWILFIAVVLLTACGGKSSSSNGIIDPVDWSTRKAQLTDTTEMITGSTYLSVYSEIYDMNRNTTHKLTATVSMRNISQTDTVYLFHADYYNTAGDLIRKYFSEPVYIRPLETIEVVVDQDDDFGGTGGNFILEWCTPANVHEPLFEAVMISTTGQQGISFTTRGVKR